MLVSSILKALLLCNSQVFKVNEDSNGAFGISCLKISNLQLLVMNTDHGLLGLLEWSLEDLLQIQLGLSKLRLVARRRLVNESDRESVGAEDLEKRCLIDRECVAGEAVPQLAVFWTRAHGGCWTGLKDMLLFELQLVSCDQVG